MASAHTCVVSDCCCGCTLRTGSLIIGWLSLIGDVITSANLGIQLSYAGWWLIWATLAIQIMHLVVSILLLVGISNNNVQFIKTFVYVNTIILVYNGVISITFFIMAASYYYGGAFVAFGVVYLFEFGCAIYYTVVIRSYAISLEEGPMQSGMLPYQQGQQVVVVVQPGQPGWQPGQPGMAPGQPGWQPGQPGMAQGQPGWQPGQPGMAPGQPGWQPGQPGMAPGQPGWQPGQPGMAPGLPGWQPGQSGMAPGQPGSQLVDDPPPYKF